MTNPNAHKNILTGYFLLASFETAGVMFFSQLISFDSKSQPALGNSWTSLFLIAGFSAAFIFLAGLALRTWRNSVWAENIWQMTFSHPQRTFGLFCAASAFFLTLWLIPPYRFGPWESFAARLSPGVILGTFLCVQTCIGLLIVWKWTGHEFPRAALQKQTKKVAAITLVIFGLIWVWVAVTKFGVVPNANMQWDPAGVPLLTSQVWTMVWLLVALILGSAFFRQNPSVEQSQKQIWMREILIGLGIWAITAVLWVFMPLPHNFFFPGPYPPKNVIYPYADTANWDIGGQFALIGQGITNSNPFQDHAGYSGFLAFLHLLLGQDYARISAFQAALLAIFPMLIYWLGRVLHSRLAGLLIAGLAILHELNTFAASSMLDISHARFLLTEYPVRVGLAALTLWLFLWLREPKRGTAYALPVGGVLAFMILLRYNTLALPFAVLAGLGLFFGRNWKTWVRSSLIITLSLSLVLSPWMWRSWELSGNPLFFLKKSGRIFEGEFRQTPLPTPTPSSPTSFLEETSASLTTQPVRADASVNSLYSTDSNNGIGQISTLVASHFVHNLITSVLILPTNLAFHNLQHTIYEVHPYWNKLDGPWDGNLTLQEMFLLAVNLVLISMGIGFAWKKWKLASWVPMGIYLAYDLSLAVARVSGGRYIVPMDWVILFYWGIGITQIILWGTAWMGVNSEKQLSVPETGTFSYKKGWSFTLPFLLFVVAMIIMERSIPQRYSEMGKSDVLGLLTKTNVLQQTDITTQEVAAFLEQEASQALIGRGLYPRFYTIGQGEYSAGTDAYEPEKYPRLAFILIGTFGKVGIVLPFVRPPSSLREGLYFSHASDLIVLGCKNPNGIIDAILVVVPGDEPHLYLRQPEAPLQCPLPQPVCENNQSCR